MDNAMHFLDELKKGMQHQVEQAIEDWDYQDFSPDKRRALLEEEVSNDVDDDRQPEPGAMQLILKDSNRQLNWTGLSPEAALEDFDCGATLAAHASLSYESKVVIMCTPAGGIQGTPDADSLQRFLNKAQYMNPQLLADALYARLQDPNTCWQIRSKVLVLVHALTEASHPLAPRFLPSLQNNAALLQQMEKLRTLDHNHVVRENARKAMSLLRSDGMNPMLIVNDPAPAKPHVRHVRVARDQDSTLASVRKKPVVAKKTMTPPPPPLMAPKMDTRPRDELQQHTSPKIARAVLASWRRRKSQENVFGSDMQANVMPSQHPPDAAMYKQQLMMQQSNGYTTSNAMNQQGQPMAVSRTGSIVRSGSSSRYQSGQISAFAFIQ
uniref:Uncharacterized protein n=1 Tax=Globisporangium ultimum (strain ATCC 200006 / CBS 805.95 / DAOM BR144) TaxID=431595 RepID=K3WT71_GLOUD